MTREFSHEIAVLNWLSPLDWTVIVLFFLLVAASVVYGQHKKDNPADDDDANFLDLMIMGRRLTLPLFVGTLVATWYGGILGVTSIAFESGIYNFITQGVFWYVAYLIFAFFLVDKIQKYQAITMPDLIKKQFGPISGKISAFFCFFDILPIAYVISIGLFLQVLFPATALWQLMIYGVLAVMAYSMWGGYRSVVFSDFILFITMCVSVVLVALASVNQLGIQILFDKLPATHFSPTGGESIPSLMVWGFVALTTLADPNFYQPVFAAKSPQTAKRGLVVATFIWFCFDICTTLGGMYARATMAQANPGQSYLIYAVQILPPGMRGLILCGILATIISTLDSMLFQSGATLAYDIMPEKFHRDSKKAKALHYLGVVLCALFSLLLANAFNGNIKTVWKTLGSYQTACLLLPMMVGHLFPGKVKDAQFAFACIIGIVATSYWRLATHSGFWANVDELYAGVAATTLALLLYHPFFKFISKKEFTP